MDMTPADFRALVEDRLVSADKAALIAGYAFRQGFWRAVGKGIMPRPVIDTPNLSLWDAREVELAAAKAGAK